jgi:hypothetical protein
MFNFQSKPLIRLLKVLSGLSILILLGSGKGYLSYMDSFKGVNFNRSTIFLYQLYISYHRIKYIKEKLQS